jgi:hypothetical protein
MSFNNYEQFQGQPSGEQPNQEQDLGQQMVNQQMAGDGNGFQPQGNMGPPGSAGGPGGDGAKTTLW